MTPGSIYFEFHLPSNWPPTNARGSAFELVRGDTKITLNIVDGGRPQLTLDDGQRKVDYLYQAILPVGQGYIKAAFSWGDDQNPPEFAMNGLMVSLDKLANGAILEFPAKPLTFDKSDGVSFTEEALLKLTPAERLMVETLREIEVKLKAGTGYELLRVSALLRQLMLEELPLVDVVNREYNLKLRYKIIDFVDPSKIIEVNPIFACHSFFPNGREFKEVNRRQLFESIAIEADGQKFDVRETIQACANFMGGVHFREPRGEAEKKIIDLAKTMNIHGAALSMHVIGDVSKVIIDGLMPLVAAIAGRYG